MGGNVENPTYEAVCQGTTGHAEAIKIEYDPKLIKIEDILEVFFDSHDPTTLNQQGADVGSQYRSAIFYTNENQKAEAEKIISLLSKTKKVVTEVEAASNFYPAENYHQNYYKENPEKMYCQIVINPKIEKLQKEHADLVDKNKI